MTDRFEVDGVHFELEPLKPKTSSRLLKPLGKVLAPFADLKDSDEGTEIQFNLSDVIPKMVENLDVVDQFTAVFRKSCKVGHDKGGDEPNLTFVPLDACYDKVFTRKHKLLISWLIECVKLEFSDFLSDLESDDTSEGQS